MMVGDGALPVLVTGMYFSTFDMQCDRSLTVFGSLGSVPVPKEFDNRPWMCENSFELSGCGEARNQDRLLASVKILNWVVH